MECPKCGARMQNQLHRRRCRECKHVDPKSAGETAFTLAVFAVFFSIAAYLARRGVEYFFGR